VLSTPRNYMAEFFFRASAAIRTGADPEDPSLPDRAGLERRARLANARALWSARNAEELMLVARRPREAGGPPA
jgi:hypothetical protein